MVDDTERPAPGVELYATPADFRSGGFGFDAESLTDDQGRFRFSNLDDRPYRIGGRNVRQISAPNDQTWTPGDKRVVLHTTMFDKSLPNP